MKDDGGEVEVGGPHHGVSMTLPAGSYVIEARATLMNRSLSSGANAFCRLPGGPHAHKYLNNYDRGGHDAEEIVELTTAINHAGGTLEVLRCWSDVGHYRVGSITVLVTPVGSVLAG